MPNIPAGDLYDYLRGQFADSGLVGYVPDDGAKFGITNGSPEEWARFGLAVAKQESDLNSRSYNASDPGGSAGLFQFGQGQTQFTQGQDQFDPQNSANAFVRSVQHYVGNGGNISDLGATFGSIRRPNETLQHMDWAGKVAGQQGGALQLGSDTTGSTGTGTVFQPNAPAAATATTAGADPLLVAQIKQMQAALALNQPAQQQQQPGMPQLSAGQPGQGYASLNLAGAGGGGGMGNYGLIQAIRLNRARQALAIQNAAKAGGQLAQGALQLPGLSGMFNPGTSAGMSGWGQGQLDPFSSGGPLAFG
jgi:hypothetical protein